MDIQRKPTSIQSRGRLILYVVVAALALIIVGTGISRLSPAVPTVERSTVWVDTVKQGSMLRQVRGVGTLVPEEILWIPAITEGRVQSILVKPGAMVSADTVVLELSNPELEQTVVEAEMQLKATEAELTSLRVQLENQYLNLRASAATVQADYSQAKLQAEVNESLAKEGLVSELANKLSKVRAEELAVRHEIEQKRLEISAEAKNAQLEAQGAKVEQHRAHYRIKERQIEALKVRAGISGVLQEVPVEVGQRVTPGTSLARVANPERLRAEIRVPETQARDIALGQIASVDTRNGVVQGRVSRIDPAVRNGTVAVDIALEGSLPKGARPDLSIDGTIEIARLDDTIFMGRPAFAQEQSTVGIFVLLDGGKSAVRKPVKLGRSSINIIEILDGLKPGDQVILSDMSQWAESDRVRLR